MRHRHISNGPPACVNDRDNDDRVSSRCVIIIITAGGESPECDGYSLLTPCVVTDEIREDLLTKLLVAAILFTVIRDRMA